MMRFKLCYPIPNQPNHYIAPQLLKAEQPNYTWEKSHNLILSYKYEFMPKGMLTRFIVETHPWIEQQKLVWRNGVVLNKNNTRAEIIENYNQKEIKVRVAGNQPRQLLGVVTHELDKIHGSFERLQYQTLVPCNCTECSGDQNPYSYPLENLQRRLQQGRYQIECENSFEIVDVRRLIDDVNLPVQKYKRKLIVVDPELYQQLEREKNYLARMNYNLRAIANLINQALTDNDFNNLVFFNFPDVQRQLTPGMTRGQQVRILLDYVQKRQKIGKLLAVIQSINPTLYQHFVGKISLST